jgi:hypothetical protein
MSQDLSPHTKQIVVDNFFVGLHFRAFIETENDDPTVLFSLNDVSNAGKVDFVSATGGSLRSDGRKGILVYMRWTKAFDMGDTVTITLWQRGAEEYGDPQRLPEDGFDPEKPTAIFVGGRS